MRLTILLVLGWMVCLVVPATASSWDGACAVHFYGDSTLHAFDGTGACEAFDLTVETQDGKSLIRRPRVEVAVAGLDTDNSARDKKMRAMFDSDNYPRIVGRFGDLDPDALINEWQASPEGELDFELTIRNVSHPVKAKVHALKVNPARIDFTLDFTLSLESFGLEPPGVFGIIRVDDAVRLAIDVSVNRSATLPADAATR